MKQHICVQQRFKWNSHSEYKSMYKIHNVSLKIYD